MQLFSNDLGVDLGTSNVLINVDGKGVMVREPSVVAVDKNTGKILQVGAAARNMLGRTPGNVVAMRPLKDGVISDHEMTVKLLQTLFRNVSRSSIFDLFACLKVSIFACNCAIFCSIFCIALLQVSISEVNAISCSAN
jgi:actin-like ATPase involved in cell morphogenesis